MAVHIPNPAPVLSFVLCECGHPARYHRCPIGDSGPLGGCIVEAGFQNGKAGSRCACREFQLPRNGKPKRTPELIVMEADVAVVDEEEPADGLAEDELEPANTELVEQVEGGG